jgi:hypothetical protein
MTDAQLKKLAKENNFEPTYELISFARLVLINAKIKDLKSVAINTRAAVRKEREACAKICEEGTEEPLSVTALKICLRERNRIANAIRARSEE